MLPCIAGIYFFSRVLILNKANFPREDTVSGYVTCSRGPRGGVHVAKRALVTEDFEGSAENRLYYVHSASYLSHIIYRSAADSHNE